MIALPWWLALLLGTVALGGGGVSSYQLVPTAVAAWLLVAVVGAIWMARK